MYEGDSFFTLTPAGRTGLAALSAALAATVLWMAWRAGRAWGSFVGIVAGLVVFWLFAWVSPQVYYTYYMAIIEGLPLQLVVRAPPGLRDIANLLSFTAKPSLADHSAGVLGWLSLGAGLVAGRRGSRS